MPHGFCDHRPCCQLLQVIVDQAEVFGKEGTAFFPGEEAAGSVTLAIEGVQPCSPCVPELARSRRSPAQPACPPSPLTLHLLSPSSHPPPGSSLTGKGLLTNDGESWKRQRRLSNPAFRRAAVDTYASAMVAATSSMLAESWQTGGWKREAVGR